jgi:hydrogenase-4 component E
LETGLPVRTLLHTLATLTLVTTFALIVARQLLACVEAYAVHSLLLALVAALIGYATGITHLYVLAGVTLAVKTVLIPLLFRWLIHGSVHEKRELQFYVGVPAGLLVCGGLVLLAFYATRPLAAALALPVRPLLEVGMAVFLIGVFVTASRREAVPQVVGLLCAENGVFLAALATAYGLPLLVEFGLFFDLVITVLVMGILVGRMHVLLSTTDTEKLQRLRG